MEAILRTGPASKALTLNAKCGMSRPTAVRIVFGCPAAILRQTDMPPILSQREILAQRVMPNGEIQ